MSFKAIFGALLVLCLLPFALRLVPIAHGAPRNYVPDTHVVKNALGMAKDKDLIPPVGKYSSYPYLVPYMLLPVYAGEYVVGRALGSWHSTQEFKVRALDEPALVQLPARVLIAIFGALSAFAAFAAARALGLREGAWAAAFLIGTSLLHVQLSTHERPWVPVVFFGLLAVAAAAKHAQEGRVATLVVAAVCGALAFACHQSGLVFLGLAGLAWFCAPGERDRAGLRRRILRGVIAVVAFVVVALVVGHPYYLRYGRVPTEFVVGGDQAADKFSVGGQAVRFGVSWNSVEHLAVSFFAYDPALVVLGLVGLFLWPRERRWVAVFVFTLASGFFFLTNPSDHVRYLLPVGALFALFAGRAVELGWRRPVVRALLCVLLAVPIVQAARFDVVLRREDTRAEAERRLAQLPVGARVAIDHYGPAVDLDRASLERLAALRELRQREANRLEFLKLDAYPKDRLGLDAYFVEDLCGVDPSTGRWGVKQELASRGATPRELFAALGVTHVLLVDRGERDGAGSRLVEVARDGRELWRVNPSGTTGSPTEAFLPTEMLFPLTALWSVERPGPDLRLVELAATR
ncbi:MAG: glycosyltransferase family 39 protein [Planctomycetes bacterium]|nr:glycosyltransferase family 39 protein [Planctomycetota bacterium]